MPRRHRPLRHRIASADGFTLVELMVVIVIIGLLAAIVTPRYLNSLEKGKQETARAQIATFKNTLQLFYLAQGFYPESLEALIVNPGDSRIEDYPPGGYLDTNELPKDPWGNEYVYVSPGANSPDYDIESYGRDGLDGGDGFDADIESWRL